MIRNYLLIAFRNLTKYKLFSVLNIFGLALGIACIVFIYSFIEYELSFEKCYPKSERIYRVTSISRGESTTRYWAPTAPLLGPQLAEQMPEIESFCRFYQIGGISLSVKDAQERIYKFNESGGFFADTSAIEMFDFKFISGNPKIALKEIHSIVITEELAERFFKGEAALGKSIQIDRYQQAFIVSGVVENLTGNTHLNISYMIPMEYFRQMLVAVGREGLFNARGWAGPYNYILLKENSEVESIEAKMDDFIVRFWEGDGTREEVLNRRSYPLQPIRDIHLHSKLEQEIGPNSDVTYVYIFLSVAILILIIGGVNYVNISTAQSMRRIKEIGIRKVIGAYRGQIITQYFGESLMITVLAGILSILLIDLAYPYFNQLSGLEYTISQFFALNNIILMILIVIVLGLVAGIYPALLASGFSIEDNIKGAKKVGSFSHQLRKVLVILQFAISIFLIFSTLSIFKQLRLFNDIDLGFTKENVVSVRNSPELSRPLYNDYAAFKAEMKSNPIITDISSVSDLPGERTSVETLMIENYTHPSGNMPSMRFIRADNDYLKTMNIQLLEGKDFHFNSDTTLQFLINEKCKAAIGMDDPIGKYATNIWGDRGRIVGVMSDFNFASLHESIEPLVIEYDAPEINMNMLFRYNGDSQEAIMYIETKLKEYDPGHIFEYTFITDQWDSLYNNENKAGNTFTAFTILAIIISCIGLFGLSAFTAESRMKEMGIRKVHGAGLWDITKAFGTVFFILIIIASVFAIPAGWLSIQRWLQDFEYQSDMSWLYIVFSLAIILGIAFLTILYQMIKVFRANPIDYIKYE